MSVTEQRGTSLILGILLCGTMFLEPVLTLIPRGVLWAYFGFMAIESLPGNQLWHRMMLLITDKHHRRVHHIGERVPVYVDTVPFGVTVRFTLLQLTFLVASYGITWAGAAGIVFPIIILLTLPARYLLVKRFFEARWLRDLDRNVDVEEIIEEEEPGEVEEEQEDVHNFFSGEVFGGHGAFGQVSSSAFVLSLSNDSLLLLIARRLCGPYRNKGFLREERRSRRSRRSRMRNFGPTGCQRTRTRRCPTILSRDPLPPTTGGESERRKDNMGDLDGLGRSPSFRERSVGAKCCSFFFFFLFWACFSLLRLLQDAVDKCCQEKAC